MKTPRDFPLIEDENDEDAWLSYVAHVNPIHARHRRRHDSHHHSKADQEKPSSEGPSRTQKPTEVSRHQVLALPPLQTMPMNFRRKIGKGAIKIEATLDLHHLNRSAAEERLRTFLSQARMSNQRLVLVITGKGRTSRPIDLGWEDGGQEGGVLFRSVRYWLGSEPYRHLVIGFDEALPSHGGSGALYVRIRKKAVART